MTYVQPVQERRDRHGRGTCRELVLVLPHILNSPVGIDVRRVVCHGLSVKILEQQTTTSVYAAPALFKVLVIGRDPVERVFMVQKDDPGLESSSVGHQVSMRHGMFHLVVVERAAPPPGARARP